MQSKNNYVQSFAWAPALAVLASLVFLIGGCKKEDAQPAGPPPAPEVSVMTIAPEAIMLTTELPGRTSAYRVAEIRPQISGIIQKRLFTEGAEVKAGDVLYQIDPAPFEAALKNAEAAHARSEANLPAVRSRAERYKGLLAENAVSQQDYEDAAAALKQAQADIQYWQAALDTARINLEYTRITAPISGHIGRSSVTEGAIVTAYQPVALATIQQLDPIYVDVHQSTTDLMRLKKRLAEGHLDQNGESQKEVKIIMADNTEYPEKGSLQFRDVTVDPSTGSVIIRAVFPNPERALLPGMFVRAVVKEGVNEQAILIPQQSVSRDPRGNPVALIVGADNTVGKRLLEVDRAIVDKWLVSSGLVQGDRLIVEGIQKVRPGMTVKTVPLETASGPDNSEPGAASNNPESN